MNRFTITPYQRQWCITSLQKRNIQPIFEYVFEDRLDNKRVYSALHEHLERFPEFPIAIKLSSFGTFEYINRLKELYSKSKSVIYIDAEHQGIPHGPLVDHCWNKDILVAKTYQMYKKNEINVLENDINRWGDSVWYKIVRGAYWMREKNTGALFIKKEDTDKQYNDAIELSKDLNTVLYATHNKESLSKVPQGKSVSQLLGMADKVSDDLAKTHKVYKYVPFGNFYESLPYLGRRLYENVSVINHLV